MNRERVMVADITEPGRGVGFSERADVDFLITRDEGLWVVYESTGKPLQSKGRTVKGALQAFAGLLGLSGTIELRWETRGDRVEVFEV